MLPPGKTGTVAQTQGVERGRPPVNRLPAAAAKQVRVATPLRTVRGYALQSPA